MLFLFLAIAITVYGFYNYKKAFMLFLIYEIYGLVNIPLFTVAGKKVIISLGCMAVFFALHFINNYKYASPPIRLPYLVPFLLITISELSTCTSSVAGVFNEITGVISRFFANVVLVWLMWENVDTDEDFKFLFKGFTSVIFIACIYGFFEYMTGSNVILDYKMTLIQGFHKYSMSDGRGYRIYSLFEHPIGAGMCYGLFAVTVLLLINRFDKVPMEKFAVLTALLCVPCVVLTKMRSAILFTILAFIPALNFRRKKIFKIMLILLSCIIAAWPFIGYYATALLGSFFGGTAYDAVGGSNLEMRLSQFQAILQLMKNAPFTGLGATFEDYISNAYTKAALGYESVWFEQMAAHGLFGIVSYIVFAIYSLIIIPRRFRSKEIFFISLAYWVTNSLTTIPSFRMPMYYMPLFFFIKHSSVYQNKSTSNKRRLKIKLKI